MNNMELHLDNMLEVSELIIALTDREKHLIKTCHWEDENGLARTAIRKLINQVRAAYPYMFGDDNN